MKKQICVIGLILSPLVLTSCFSESFTSSENTIPSSPSPTAPNVISMRKVAGVAYSGPTDLGSTDGTPGKFKYPSGISADANYFYVGENGNHIVRRINRTTGAVQTIAGLAGASGFTDGIGSAARFGWPMETLISGSTLYVSDMYYHCIRAIDVSDPTFPVSTIAGGCGSAGTTDDVGNAARFERPGGMALVAGHLYVADFNNHTIRKIQLSDMDVTTVAGTAGVSGFTDDIGLAAQFNMPMGLHHYVDPIDGDVLFITDQSNNAVRRFNLSDDTVTTVADSLAAPWGITDDGTSLYVGNMYDKTIIKIKMDDYSKTTFIGSSATVDVFGPVSNASISAVSSLYYDFFSGLVGTTDSALYRIQ